MFNQPTNGNKPLPERATGNELLVAQFEQLAVYDQCNAVLTKNCLDNTASLVAYASHLCDAVPAGRDAFAALIKCYVVNAGRKIMGGDSDYDPGY